MPVPTPSPFPPGQGLARLTELLHALESACARMDEQLRRLEKLPTAGGEATLLSEGREKQPWALFEKAPAVAGAPTEPQPVMRIPPQPIPLISAEIQQETLNQLNEALGAAFQQVVRGQTA